MNTERTKLINLTGEEAYSQLNKFWNGELNTADTFSDETGEDYEQCLVDHLTSIKFNLSNSGIKLVINRYNNDYQFYELIHWLLVSQFEPSTTTLNHEQKYILKSLCKHDAIWKHDEEFIEILNSLSLPIGKQAMKLFLK